MQGQTAVTDLASVSGKRPWQELMAEARLAFDRKVEFSLPPSNFVPLKDPLRDYIDPEGISRLAESFRMLRQLYPGIVRPSGPVFEIIDGQRRWHAAQEAGTVYYAWSVDISDEAIPFLIAAVMNFNREAHTPLEIQRTIEIMYDEYRMPMPEVAKALNMKVGAAYKMLSLRLLSEEVRGMLDPTLPKQQRLPVTSAVTIAQAPVHLQKSLAQKVLKGELKTPVKVRTAVVEKSKAIGVDVRVRNNGPEKQLVAHANRVAEMAAAAEALLERMSKPEFRDFLAGSVSSRSVITTMCDDAERVRQALNKCSRILSKAG